MNNTLITIVTVCYNAGFVIADTMRSVLRQSYDNLEYIIIDGGSSDGTLQEINKVIEEFPPKKVLLISEPDEGIYDAMNKGINLATGDWINFMNAGDEFANDHVIKDILLLLQDDKDVVFGNTIMRNGRYLKQSKGGLMVNEFPKIGHQSSFVKIDLMKKYHFNTKYVISADFDFLFRLYQMKSSFFYIDMDVAIYNMDGVSSNHRELLYREHCEIRKQKPSWRRLLKYKIEDNMPIQLMKWLIRFKYA